MMDSGDESEDEPMYTGMLEDIRGGSKSHPNINRREAQYTICYLIKQIQSEWKVALKYTRNMGKGLHKVFKTIVKEISQDLTILVESGSEVYYFILEPRNFAEVKKLSDYIKKPWIKASQKEIENIINNHTLFISISREGLYHDYMHECL